MSQRIQSNLRMCTPAWWSVSCAQWQSSGAFSNVVQVESATRSSYWRRGWLTDQSPISSSSWCWSKSGSNSLFRAASCMHYSMLDFKTSPNMCSKMRHVQVVPSLTTKYGSARVCQGLAAFVSMSLVYYVLWASDNFHVGTCCKIICQINHHSADFHRHQLGENFPGTAIWQSMSLPWACGSLLISNGYALELKQC